jgi:hypothetical protein
MAPFTVHVVPGTSSFEGGGRVAHRTLVVVACDFDLVCMPPVVFFFLYIGDEKFILP